MTILPITYLGGVEWFSRLLGGDAIIDLGENWVKQTARNRCEIMTSGGVSTLTVPVHAGHVRLRDVRIDMSKRWTAIHWKSIVSAYRNSPFFDHYEELFAPIYERRHEFLVDLNLELLNVLAAILGATVQLSDNYIVASPNDLDLRGKKSLRRGSPTPEYFQIFSDPATPFESGLSVIDLLFCEGPSAREILQRQ